MFKNRKFFLPFLLIATLFIVTACSTPPKNVKPIIPNTGITAPGITIPKNLLTLKGLFVSHSGNTFNVKVDNKIYNFQKTANMPMPNVKLEDKNVGVTYYVGTSGQYVATKVVELAKEYTIKGKFIKWTTPTSLQVDVGKKAYFFVKKADSMIPTGDLNGKKVAVTYYKDTAGKYVVVKLVTIP